jgi:6-oxo-cyclohex-1-ene-carbonyl-CoA hydrolase
MSLDWLPREGGIKNHDLYDDAYLNGNPPTVNYELKAIKSPDGKTTDGLNSAWITLNNPQQYNSYTTEMVKGVIAAFHRASMDRTVVAVVFTAEGDRAFCTGGNTKEYAEYYAGKPTEYGLYMDLFNAMVDAILMCKKPVICRVNGMRVAGGQEIGMACDLAISGDHAVYGQAGPRHGSAPDGGSTDFLPWYLTIEDALWNCVSCELWSAYKMKRVGLISKAIKVYKENGKYIPNPQVITHRYVEDGDIIYGEFLTGDAGKAAREKTKSLEIDFSLLDKEVNKILWTFTNLFPNCLMKSIDGIRQKKKFFWDQTKLANRHWLAANMQGEAYLGFHAFNTKKITGKDVIDFIKYRQLIAEGHALDEDFFEQVLGKPQG